MKNILKLSLLFFTLQSQSQTIIKPAEQYFQYISLDNIYFKDVNHIYDKFLGTWEYSNGPHYLKVVILKRENEEQGVTSTGRRMRTRKHFLDYIDCNYIYKYNGVEIYNLLPPLLSPDSPTGTLIYGHLIKNPNQLDIAYDEPSTTSCDRERLGNLILTYSNSGAGPAQLQWNRTDKLSGIL